MTMNASSLPATGLASARNTGDVAAAPAAPSPASLRNDRRFIGFLTRSIEMELGVTNEAVTDDRPARFDRFEAGGGGAGRRVPCDHVGVELVEAVGSIAGELRGVAEERAVHRIEGALERDAVERIAGQREVEHVTW